MNAAVVPSSLEIAAAADAQRPDITNPDTTRPDPTRPDITRPDITRAVCRGAARHLMELGHAVVAEVTFPSGRRADLLALGNDGRVVVVEVKSCLADFSVDAKWNDYRAYCDALYFAVAADFPVQILPDDAGLIVADNYGGMIVRHAPAHPLAPARRKAVTMLFARTAAGRLRWIEDPRL